VDNFLLTDDEVYDRRSDDDELDCEEIGTVPKYSVLDASFITKGDTYVVTHGGRLFLAGLFMEDY